MLMPLPCGARTPLTSRNTTTIATSATTMTAMIPDELLCSMRNLHGGLPRALHAGRVPVERGPLGRGLTELEALDLARGRLRKLGDELHPARVFVRRERALHERLELVRERRRRGRALGADDVRARLDKAVAVRPRDHRALTHGRVPQEDGLDLER